MLRVLVDILLVVFGMVIVMGFRALKPARMPVLMSPEGLGLKSQAVTFRTSDGKDLKGWLIPSEKSRAVIICLHGYPANKSDILPVVRFLHPEFTLFLFDFRAHGESGGFITTFGLKEVLDVEAAIEYLKSVPSLREKPVGIWGYSLGGAVGILTAAKNPEIKTVVSDSAFANFPEMVTIHFKNMGPLKYVFSLFSRLLGRIVFRMDFMENSPEFHIKDVKAPILLIHSGTDEFIPFRHAQRLYRNANEPRELWKVGGTHTGVDQTELSGYQAKVSGWFRKYLKQKAT